MKTDDEPLEEVTPEMSEVQEAQLEPDFDHPGEIHEIVVDTEGAMTHDDFYKWLKGLTQEELLKFEAALIRAFADLGPADVSEKMDSLFKKYEAEGLSRKEIAYLIQSNFGSDTVWSGIRKGVGAGKSLDYTVSVIVGQLFNALNLWAEQELPKVQVTKRLNEVNFPTDKVNANIWGMRTYSYNGDYFDVDVTSFNDKKKGKPPIHITCAICFDELTPDIEIVRRLTPYDREVYNAVSSLWANGCRVVTISQIYRAMGGRTVPSKFDRDKINASLTKMSMALLYLNNEEEITAGYKYQLSKVHAENLLHITRDAVLVNGKLVKDAIKILSEPVLFKFARERKQITTIPLVIKLENPLDMRDESLCLSQYLTYRIARAKNDKSKDSGRILYRTIYERCYISTPMQRKRAKDDKIPKLLSEWKKLGFIKKFAIDKDGISVE